MGGSGPPEEKGSLPRTNAITVIGHLLEGKNILK